jgi:hypothetical protein
MPTLLGDASKEGHDTRNRHRRRPDKSQSGLSSVSLLHRRPTKYGAKWEQSFFLKKVDHM